jgi:hypothetical protein
MDRRWMYPALVLSGILLSGCASSTHREIDDAGTVVVHSGPTVIGWALIGFGTVIGTIVLIGVLLGMPVAIFDAIRDEVDEAREPRNWWKITGLAAAVPLLFAFLGLFAWAFASATVLHFHGSVVTASHAKAEVEVKRTRLIGGSDVRTWRYADIASIEFHYVPATGDEPASGTVYVRAQDRTRALIFEGEPCPARDLAEAMRSATNAPVKIDSGTPIVASFGALFTRVRCGIQRPWHPTPHEFPTWAIVVSVLLFVGFRIARAALR